MKNIPLLLTATLAAFIMSCSSSTTDTGTKTPDGTDTSTVTATSDTVITGKIALPQSVKAGDPLEIKFTVYNNTDSTRKFLKWQTPFEPLLSKYLDITSETGEEVLYHGPMAKRMMPPPADAYTTLKSKDSISVTADISKAYPINKPGKYWVKYNSEGVSGVVVRDSVMVEVK